MPIIKYFLFLSLSFIFAQAQSFLVSAVPLPKTYVLNTDVKECDDACLYQLIEEERFFSFLAHAKKLKKRSSSMS